MPSKINQLLIILGPTATGKTELALQLAHKFQGEVVSADSRQVYKGLDIGTGKLSSKVKKIKKEEDRWIIDGIPINLYDVVSAKTPYNVASYVKDATKVIEDIRNKRKLPIIVGGTGFYIKAITDGLPNLSLPVDKKMREKLEKLSLSQLQIKLKQQLKKRWDNMNNSDRQNPRRLIRAIEIASTADNKHTAVGLMSTANILRIGLSASRETLYQRADQRVINRINQGMIEETERLNKRGLSLKRMKQLGLEYGVLADYLDKKIKTKDELVKILQNKIHGYIKRQQTWFKKEKNIIWFDISKSNFFDQVEKRTSEWYDSSV